MRIIQISPAYKPAYIYGGPTLSVSLLCEALVEAGIPLQVFTTTANGAQELEATNAPVKIDGVSVTYFRRTIRGQIHLSFGLLIRLYFSTDRNDIFHIHSWWNATAILSALVGKMRDNRVVLSPRGMLTPYSFNNRHSFLKKMFHYLLGKWILNSCEIHVTSEKERRDVSSFVKRGRITTIPNLANELILYRHSDPIPMEETATFKLLFLSRIEEKKGIELLFEALKHLSYPWVLTVAGSGNPKYLDDLQSLAAKLNIEDSITWVGFVNLEEKRSLMMEHDLFVLFSHNENFANVITESLSAGLPVAVSEEVGLSDFILEHDLGWVSELDKFSIVAKLEDAAKNIDKRSRIKQIAPSLIAKHFSIPIILPQYFKLYELDEY